MGNNVGKVACKGRSAHLVEHHFQRIVCCGKALHGLHKVLSPLRVEPCCSYDDTVTSRSGNCCLACKFRFAVDAERISRPVFLAWRVAVALENIVGTYMYQRTACFLHCCSQIACSRVVYQIGCVVVAFGFVYVGVCSTVNDYVHIVILHHIAYILDICNVKFLVAVCHVGEYIVVVA